MKTDRNGTNDFIADVLQQPLEVVFLDEHYVAVYKPAGLMVHRGPKTCASEPVLLQALRDQLDRFLYPVHRLDRPTAGVVVFGLTTEAAARMGKLFAHRRVIKHYQALVWGELRGVRTVDHPLVDPDDAHDGPAKKGKASLVGLEAVTHFRGLKYFEVDWLSSGHSKSKYSLVEVQPDTGRWHQIRRHLAFLSSPVVGDYRHGDLAVNECFSQRTGVCRMLLTAMRLEFRHPFTGEPTAILVPRGDSFERALEALQRGGTRNQ